MGAGKHTRLSRVNVALVTGLMDNIKHQGCLSFWDFGISINLPLLSWMDQAMES